ncbi:GNAT family N-acetyltransferase [Methylopila musalis]|uniref:GNAT family N-acetyltransferase n=1 Tax=Methylopila musalis TaxID=1134781 RepID=A0ABW3Z4S9_9HYPH
MSSVSAASPTRPAAPRSAAADGARVFERIELRTSVAEADAVWRELLGEGVATPYQTPAFLSAWADNVGRREGVEIAIAIARDAEGRAVALLPLGVSRRFGLRVASYLGGTHVNYNLPVFARDAVAAFTPPEVERLLREIAAAARVDLFALSNQPESWRGAPNPLAGLPRQPSPDFAYSGRLEASVEAHLKRYVSAKTRSAQRRKLRRFEERGVVRIYRAETDADRTHVLDAYFAQKAQRLAARGIDNVFAEPGVEDFIRAAAGLAAAPPAIDLYGFDLDGEVIATFGVIADRDRMCGMFNSITSGDLARYSPGELLLTFMVEDAIGRGMTEFDLGVGAAAYKALFCADVDPLFDTILGVSPLGRAGAGVFAAKRAAKAWVKSNSAVYAFATRIRKLRARDVERHAPAPAAED